MSVETFYNDWAFISGLVLCTMVIVFCLTPLSFVNQEPTEEEMRKILKAANKVKRSNHV